MKVFTAMMWAIILVALFICVCYTIDASEIKSFKHYTGYDRSTIEIEADEPTTWTVRVFGVGDKETKKEWDINDMVSSVTLMVEGLRYETLYGVDIAIIGSVFKSDKTGYRLQTLNRWQLIKNTFRDNEIFDLFLDTLTEVAPGVRDDFMDALEVELLTKVISDKKTQRDEESKALKPIEEYMEREPDKTWE